MSRQEILKVQTLELQVPIHCEGCLKQVKKIVQKIDGVYQSSVDVALGKVTVTGLMDPETVITKIRKTGKPVWVWGTEPGTPVEVQLEMLQLGGTASDGKGQLLQQPKDGGAAKDAKMVAPQPPPPTRQPMQAARAKDPCTVKFNHTGGDEFVDDDSSWFRDVFDELEDIDFEDDGLGDDFSDGPATMTRPTGMPPGAASGSNGGAKNGGGAPPPTGAGLGGPMMRPPHMLDVGGGAGFPGVRRMGGEGRPLGGMRMGHLQLGGAGTQQGGGATHGKPAGGMPVGMGLPNMSGAGMPQGGGFVHDKPAGGMPMGHPHLGGTGMQPSGSGARDMPAAGFFPGGGGMMPIGSEMLLMSQLPPQQQQMAAMMQQQQQQQQQRMAAITQQQQQMLLNGHGHHHAHYGQHQGHHAQGGGHGYPPAVAVYEYGRPPMLQYPPMPYYYSLPPQRHPHDYFFSDENPNGCSVM